MSTFTHRVGVALPIVLIFLIICVYLLPRDAHGAEDDLELEAASSTEVVLSPSSHTYKTESLLGDEIVGDFVVGPGKVELEIKPGQSKVVEITVSNRTGAPRVFELTTEDAAGSNDPSQTLVLLGDDRGPYSLKDYITFETAQFELPHNIRARVPIKISVPADAEPGGLYGSVLVSTVSKEAEAAIEVGAAPQSAVVARIGTLFFITVPGEVTRGGMLKEFGTIAHQKFYQSGPIAFGLLFENTGAVHLSPHGEIRIQNVLGEEVGAVELEPWFVLPLSTRLREITWNRGFLFGRYVATAEINRGYGDTVDSLSYAFWVLPWKILLAGFALVFLIVFLIRLFFRTFEFKRKN